MPPLPWRHLPELTVFLLELSKCTENDTPSFSALLPQLNRMSSPQRSVHS